jgi:small conductance mechanosensitive channel
MRYVTGFRWMVALIVMALGPAVPWASGQDGDVGSAGSVAERLVDTPASELAILLAPLPVEELEEVASAALAQVREAGEDLAAALIEQKRAHDAEATDAERERVDARVEELLVRRSGAVARAGVVLEALKLKGADVASREAYVGVVERLTPEVVSAAGDEQLSDEERAAAELDRRVSRIVSQVRDEPPVHERDEPWTVPLSELELELQPLGMDRIEERLKKWLTLVQREVRERIRIDIALQRAEDDAVRSELAGRSAAQQGLVQALVKRAQVALMMLKRRGGDTAAYEKYIANATGQKLNVRDPGVLWAQVMAWVRSSEGGVKWGRNILAFVGILAAFWVLSRLLGRAVATAVSRIPKASSLLRSFLVGGVKRLTMLIGLVVAVSALGVNITPLVAAIGAAGLVIGLALQGTLSNFASGILILIYRPYDVGDVITGGGVTGKVNSMNLVSTHVLTFDNQVLIVPNNEIWNGVITNITGQKTRRVDLTFGIAYSADIGKAVKILEETLAAHRLTLADPAPVVRVHELGDNSVNLIARPWVKTADYWDVYWDLMREVKERFDAEGIGIPFPQRDLHVPGAIEVRLADGEGRPRPVSEVEPRPARDAVAREPRSG